MTSDLQWVMAGLDRVEGFVLDSSGNISGTSSTAPTTAAGSNGFRIIGAKDGGPSVPDPVLTPITGDDNFIANFIFPSAAARTFMLQAAVQDLNVAQYMGSGNAYAIGNSEVGFVDANPFTPTNVALLFNSQLKSQTPGNVGQGIWGGIIVPRAQAIPLGRQTFQEHVAGIMRYAFIFSMADRFPWGETFNSITHGVNYSSFMPWSSNNRKAWFRATGNGAITTFGPLQYTPASTSLSDVVVYINGYRQTTGITVDIPSKNLIFSPAPANNAVVAVYYDHT